MFNECRTYGAFYNFYLPKLQTFRPYGAVRLLLLPASCFLLPASSLLFPASCFLLPVSSFLISPNFSRPQFVLHSLKYCYILVKGHFYPQPTHYIIVNFVSYKAYRSIPNTYMRIRYLVVLLTFFGLSLQAQPVNDD